VIWKLVIAIFNVSPFVLPQPEDVLTGVRDLVQSKNFWSDLRVTLEETLVGFAIALVLGLALGTLLGRVAWLEQAMRPVIVASQVVPKVALIYEGDQVRVWVAHADKTIELRQIKTGITNGDLVEVKGKRLDAVFPSVAGLDDKATVRVAGVRVARFTQLGTLPLRLKVPTIRTVSAAMARRVRRSA